MNKEQSVCGVEDGEWGGPSRGADYLEPVVHAKGICIFFQVNHLRDLGSEVT